MTLKDAYFQLVQEHRRTDGHDYTHLGCQVCEALTVIRAAMDRQRSARTHDSQLSVRV